ncbi:BtpA/SgcQ family protein [Carboxylicivirga sp. N1Y90]|uniref:BtpA/SgcQ family protein n=1 Tax=Carboxylicivirga fragile TaxID=3417571 RepID=UPI003D32F806|nr:BtpA/SgcQ family protein [Marinilabiliaceae bacterium N1Y90]
MDLFDKNKWIIAMVHVGALPGTPNNRLSISDIVANALADADVYVEAGVDAIMIENMHDVPYLNGNVGPEIVASMTVVANQLRAMYNLPIGIQILAGANKEALAVAKACNLDFIRAEGFVFSHIADEGLMNACAGELMRYRKMIDATNVKVLADIKKKHSSHAITSDVSLLESAEAASFFLSDGVIITGASTGCEVDENELVELGMNKNFPIILGSGITKENISNYWHKANAFIVGSHFKMDGKWEKEVDAKRVSEFMDEVNRLRQ